MERWLTRGLPFRHRRKTEDGRRKTEDGRRKTEDGRRKTEDGRPKTEDRRRKTEDGRPKTEDRRPKTKDPRPKTQDRRRKIEEVRNEMTRAARNGRRQVAPACRFLFSRWLGIRWLILRSSRSGRRRTRSRWKRTELLRDFLAKNNSASSRKCAVPRFRSPRISLRVRGDITALIRQGFCK